MEDAKEASYQITLALRLQTEANPLPGKRLIEILLVRLGPVSAEWGAIDRIETVSSGWEEGMAVKASVKRA